MGRREVANASRLLLGSTMGLALFYVAGPLIIAAELLKPTLSVPILAASLVWIAEFDSFLFESRTSTALDARPAAWRPSKPGRFLAPVAVLLLGTLWIFCSGIGGFTVCRSDYVKHDLVFASLLSGHLPIKADPGDGSTVFIHYYFAYYILPVRIYQGLHALFGSVRFDHLVFLIDCIVLYASLSLLAACRRLPAIALLAMLALTGGLDIVGRAVSGTALTPIAHLPGIGVPVYLDLEWWGEPMAPQSMTMNLFWAPQHFFAALIGTALLSCIFNLQRPAGAKLLHASCIIAASTLWSPYVAIGLAAISLSEIPGLLRSDGARRPGQGRWRRAITLKFCGAAVFVILLLLFAAVFYDAARATSPPALIFRQQPVGSWLLSFLLRQAPGILALAVLCIDWIRLRRRKDRGDREMNPPGLLVTFAFLLAADAVLLCFFHGTYDDWGMRTTLPISILLAAALWRFLADWPGRLAKSLVILLLGISSLSSVNEIAQSLVLPRECPVYGMVAWRDLGSLVQQYEGRSDSLLYRELVRGP